MDKLFNQSKEIVYNAGEILKSAFYQTKQIMTKSNAYDLVTDTDKEIEFFLISRLSEILPESHFLAEESSPSAIKARYLWVIDPIDGTTNFVHRFPFVCISVALLIDGDITFGFVYNPIMNEFYTARKGQGAYMNGDIIKVTSLSDFSRALLGTGFSYNFKTAEIDNIAIFKELLGKVHGIRRPGSAALDLCTVAKGVYDGYWEWYLNPWDVCAGILIIQEAGGKVSNLMLQDWSFDDKCIIASNGVIHSELISEIQLFLQA